MNDQILKIILAFVQLFAGMGVFLFGLDLMSKGLEKSADKRIRKMFARISNNSIVGVLIGTGTTAITQSSTAVSVMTLGFVNTGLMTLYQATAIIMGANIGTTLSSFIFALNNFPISDYLMLLAPIGVLMMAFDKKGKVSVLGEALVGFGLIFVGLNYMSGSFAPPDPNANDVNILNNFISSLFATVHNPFLLMTLGMVVSAIVHSSALVNAIVIIMANQAALSPMGAFYITLGANIGTCFTAVIASLNANVNAKRTAFIHVFFNVVGVALFMAFMIPLESQVAAFFRLISGNDPGIQIAQFNAIQNVVSTLLFIPFIKQIVWISEKVIPESKKKQRDEMLDILDERFLESPTLAINQVLKQIILMAKVAETNLDLSMSDVLNGKDVNTANISKNERLINHLNRTVTNFLVKISSKTVSRSDEALIGSLYHVTSDVERIGDHAENISESAQILAQGETSFSDEAAKELTAIYEKVKLLYRDAIYSFENRDEKMFKEIARREEEIDEMKKIFSDNHIERLKKGVCNVESGALFYDLLTNLERIADHLTNIAYSIRPRNKQNNPAADASKAKVKEAKV